MRTNETAMIADIREQLTTIEGLAKSLEMSAGYLDGYIEKHGLDREDGDGLQIGVGRSLCTFLASDIRANLGDNQTLRLYQEIVSTLDDAQIEALYRVKIDYQARFALQFTPITITHFLNDLHAIAFVISSTDNATMLSGVGGGLTPRLKFKKKQKAQTAADLPIKEIGEAFKKSLKESYVTSQ